MLSVGSDGKGGVFEKLSSVPVMEHQSQGRRWTPVEVDLSAYAGERVIVRLELASNGILPQRRLAWWGSPRIALRPQEALRPQ